MGKLLDRVAQAGHQSEERHAYTEERNLLHRACLPLRGRRILELGSGCGVAGLAAAALGASVVLTDVNAVVPLLETNMELNRTAINSAGGDATACDFPWEQAAATGELPEAIRRHAFDLVLAADVLYQREGRQLEALCAAIRILTTPNAKNPAGAHVILVHRARHAGLDTDIPSAVRQHTGIELKRVPMVEHHPDYCSDRIWVWVGQPT